jgi:hypothetical protein
MDNNAGTTHPWINAWEKTENIHVNKFGRQTKASMDKYRSEHVPCQMPQISFSMETREFSALFEVKQAKRNQIPQ